MILATPPRVRFAPSPTGPLHMGGVRTALYNYLFAKQNKGTFILRLEDTDQNRFVEGAENYILEALRWCGIFPDEGFSIGGDYGPYKQSERKEFYLSKVAWLLENNKAYYAFDKPTALEALREQTQLKGENFTYGPLNREHLDNSLRLSPLELSLRLEAKEPYVVRFKVPLRKNFTFFDRIKGKIQVDTQWLDDKILLKSDGMPTYHLANVVDDYAMKISHVIRGEEWLSSLPLHFLLYEAFEWKAPEFIHLPLILNDKGAGKLSKRHAQKQNFSIFPLTWEDPLLKHISIGYKEAGYLPESFLNILALLGWNPGNEKEIFSLKELVNTFSLERISKSGARFNLEKAIWINQQHLQLKSIDFFKESLEKELIKKQLPYQKEKLERIINEIKPRLRFINDLFLETSYFFLPPRVYEKGAKITPQTLGSLKEIREDFLSMNEDSFKQDKLKEKIKEYALIKKLPLINLMQALRISLVGNLKGVDLFFILEMLGKKQSIYRIDAFLKDGYVN